MSMSDPIADLLTRLRNTIRAGYPTTEAPASKLKREICDVLKREGYITGYTLEEDGKQGILRITLKYARDRSPVIEGLRRVSRPSLRIYVRSRDIGQVRGGLGISILSTSKGLMTGREARNEKLGGEVLCEVW